MTYLVDCFPSSFQSLKNFMSDNLQARLSIHWAACKSLLDSKKRRIEEVVEEKSRRETELVETLAEHESDMKSLTDLLHEKLKTLRRKLQSELVEFERNLLQKRLETSEFYSSEIDKLFENRLNDEKRDFIYIARKSGREFHGHLIDLHIQLRDSSKEKKAALTLCVDELQLRSHQLHVEKLISQEKVDSRLSALKNDAAEQESIDRKSKGEIVRLRGIRTSLAEETQSIFNEAEQTNKRLCQDISKTARNYNILFKKYRNIQTINDAKYMRIVKSNERELQFLCQKLCIKIHDIFKTVLGIEWRFPEAQDALEEDKSESGTMVKSSSIYPESSIADSRKSQQKSKYSNSKIKKVVDLISGELGWLSCSHEGVDRLHEILLQIGCESVAEIDLLVSVFFAGQDEDDEELYRTGSEVIDLVREFMTENENRRVAEAALGRRRTKAKDDKKMKERIEKEEEKHWKGLGSPVSPKVISYLEQVNVNMKSRFELFQREKVLHEKQMKFLLLNERLSSLAIHKSTLRGL